MQRSRCHCEQLPRGDKHALHSRAPLGKPTVHLGGMSFLRTCGEGGAVASLKRSVASGFTRAPVRCCCSVAGSYLTLCDPMDAAHQASLSSTTSRSLLKLMSIEWVMPSNHLTLCHPFLLLPPIFNSIRVFTSESFSGASPVLRAEEGNEYNTVPRPHSFIHPSAQQVFTVGLLCARRWLGRPVILIVPRWRCGEESACQCRRCKRHWFHLWARKIP